MTISSIVLAGGRSSRLGREKYAEVVAGKSLIERVISRVSPVSTEILVVISRRQSKGALSCPEAKTVVDLYPRRGSLGGIYTGLAHSSCFHSLAVACDMPFLNVDLLRHMIDLCPGFDAAIPRIGQHLEPLHAIYSKRCLDPMFRLLEAGDLKITRVLEEVRARYVEEEEIDAFDPEHLSFFNVNTETDLELAGALAEELASESSLAFHADKVRKRQE